MIQTHKQFDRKVPALLQSKANFTDTISMSVNREFVEGYVLVKKWKDFSATSPMLVSAEPVENGDGEFIKVKVIPYDSPTA
jgi:hypothetical protein